MSNLDDRTIEETVLFVNYASDQVRTCSLPEDFEISDSVDRLRDGESFYELVREDIMSTIGDISAVGHLMFSKGNGSGSIWGYSEKSP